MCSSDHLVKALLCCCKPRQVVIRMCASDVFLDGSVTAFLERTIKLARSSNQNHRGRPHSPESFVIAPTKSDRELIRTPEHFFRHVRPSGLSNGQITTPSASTGLPTPTCT